jgi:hypothetical protein
MTDWIEWVNAKLPHQVGADPDDGIGVDCLVMAHKVRAAAGLPTPDLDPVWFSMAADGQWERLEREWRRLMIECPAEPYALVLHRQPSCLGVGIRVDDGILIVHHRRGVQWLPADVASRLIRLKYWKPRDAAIRSLPS